MAASSIGRALLLVGSAILLGAAVQEGKPSQKEISRELARMAAEDQQDQKEWVDDSRSDHFSRRQAERAARVNEIVAAGQLASLEDWQNACWLLQHGNTPDDYLLAHVLSVPPGAKGLPFAGFASAATLDRFLQSIQRPQIFLTQSGSGDPAVFAPLEPFDDSLPESIRKAYRLDPLKRARKEERAGKTPSPRELARLLKAAAPASLPTPATEPAPEWLVRAREIVAAGALKSEEDHALAARVLLRSAAVDDLLLAHVLATAASLLGHDEGLPLTAETLDRFLLACGQPQRFGTVLEASSSLLHENLRRPYGLGPRGKER
ncbi:MAG TPA: hypothetical protein VF530_04695 [Planctomycetota bacterium]